MLKRRPLLAAFAAALLAGPAAAAEPVKASLRLKWLPQAQFAGFYVAAQKGYYKAEGLDPSTAGADFHSLGLGEPHAIASAHGDGCRDLMDLVLERWDTPEVVDRDTVPDGRIRIAVIGRPNVGKSTLVNRLIGEERVIASEMPGTTRDSIFVPFARDGREFTLIDTAGVRRRGKVADVVEKASVAKTLQAIDTAHVVIF